MDCSLQSQLSPASSYLHLFLQLPQTKDEKHSHRDTLQTLYYSVNSQKHNQQQQPFLHSITFTSYAQKIQQPKTCTPFSRRTREQSNLFAFDFAFLLCLSDAKEKQRGEWKKHISLDSLLLQVWSWIFGSTLLPTTLCMCVWLEFLLLVFFFVMLCFLWKLGSVEWIDCVSVSVTNEQRKQHSKNFRLWAKNATHKNNVCLFALGFGGAKECRALYNGFYYIFLIQKKFKIDWQFFGKKVNVLTIFQKNKQKTMWNFSDFFHWFNFWFKILKFSKNQFSGGKKKSFQKIWNKNFQKSWKCTENR